MGMAIGLISNRQCVFTVSQHIHHIHNGEIPFSLLVVPCSAHAFLFE